jgi:hypothetical protein
MHGFGPAGWRIMIVLALPLLLELLALLLTSSSVTAAFNLGCVAAALQVLNTSKRPKYNPRWIMNASNMAPMPGISISNRLAGCVVVGR